MATSSNGEFNGCTFQWKIENISYCGLKPNERLESPTFIADALEGTKWRLWLHPLGDFSGKHVSLYLNRENCSGPDVIKINYQIAFLKKDGSFVNEFTGMIRNFSKNERKGIKHFILRERVFMTERESCLPEDTLTLQCTIWNKEVNCAKPIVSLARTIFTVNRKSFVWKVDAFSTVKPDPKYIRDSFINFDIVLSNDLYNDDKIIININSFDQSIKYFSFKTNIVDSEGKKENCGMIEYFASDLKKGTITPMPLFPSKLKAHYFEKYLPNDVLYLDCECVYSTETISYECVNCGAINPKSAGEIIESKKKQHAANEKTQNPPGLNGDLKSVYNDGLFSDTELRTSTQTFPAHRVILSARSPVFRRMFSNDMKEKNSGHVDIFDLEDDTVHRMLTYVYTDSLDGLKFDSASKLYVAADKYEILSLKARCSSFMKENLCPTSACEVLSLADKHQDNDLKCFVQDYILEHDKEVFGSQEWKDFMDSHLKLAADIMYRKVYQN